MRPNGAESGPPPAPCLASPRGIAQRPPFFWASSPSWISGTSRYPNQETGLLIPPILPLLQRNPKIKWMLNAAVSDIHAGEDGKVDSVTITDTQSGETRKEATQGVFVAIGNTPNSKIFKGKLDMDDSG